MAKGKSTWKYNKLLTARRNYFDTAGPIETVEDDPQIYYGDPSEFNPTPGYYNNNKPKGTNIFNGAFQGIKNGFNNLASMAGGPMALANAAAGPVGSLIGAGLSAGLSSGAGRAISGIGNALGGIPGVGGFIQGGLNVIGGAVNGLVGAKYNDANISGIRNSIEDKNNAMASANSLDTLAKQMSSNADISGFNKSFIGRDGLLTNKVGKLTDELREQAAIAQQRYDLTMGLNADNIGSDLLRQQQINYSAFGGELNTNGADFTNNLLHINAGGSHEQNPYEGVLMGIDNEGVPNLVEEGETIFNDYVFSKRLKVPRGLRGKYKLKDSMSFADASKKFAKESEERPNDPISQNGLEYFMAELAQAQEEQKMRDQIEGLRANMAAYGGSIYAGGGGIASRHQGSGMPMSESPLGKFVLGLFTKKEDKRGSFGGGRTGGGGASASFNHAPKSEYTLEKDTVWVPMTETFNDAFGKARKKGDKTFEFNGKSYTTELGDNPDNNRVGNERTRTTVIPIERTRRVKVDSNSKAYGGKVNKFSGEEPGSSKINRYNFSNFLEDLSRYTYSRNKGNVAGNYAIDRNFDFSSSPYVYNSANINDLEANADYNNFTEYVLNNSNNEDVISYLKALDDGTHANVPKLFKDGVLTEGWKDLYSNRRRDQKMGIYHLSPQALMEELSPVNQEIENIQDSNAPIEEKNEAVRQVLNRYYYNTGSKKSPNYVLYEGEDPNLWMNNNGYLGTRNAANDFNGMDYFFDKADNPRPTWMRETPLYALGARALTDALGLTGQADYSQIPDIRTTTPQIGFTPIGNQLTYKPYDTYAALNTLNSTAGANRRALLQNAGLNRGLGAASIIAADNALMNQVGSTYAQAYDYNNKLKQAIEDFNRGTNQYNSQGMLSADQANMNARISGNQLYADNAWKRANMMNTERVRAYNDREDTMNAFLESMQNYGRTNENLNARDFLYNSGAFEQIAKGLAGYLGLKTAAKGGKIKRSKGLTI